MAMAEHTLGNTPRPVISVCIANYNGIEFIDDCLQSVLTQTNSVPVEIIVHDDASNDGSAHHILSRYPQIRLIESDRNVGFCIANNRMAGIAQGEYLLLLNNDAALFPDALATLYAAAKSFLQPTVLGLAQYDAETGKLIDIGDRLDIFLNPVPNLDPYRSNVGMVMGACLWIPKTLWEELGGFPDWFGSIGEDLYLCCLARIAGFQIRALSTSGFHHHVGGSFGGGKVKNGKLVTTFRRRFLSERNKTCVMLITYPAPILLISLPIHLLLLLAEGILLSIFKRRHAYLTEIYLPTFRYLIKQRRLIANARNFAMAKRSVRSRVFFSMFDAIPYKLRMLCRHGLPDVR